MSTTSHKAPESLIKQLHGFRRHVVIVKISEVLIAATFAFLAAWLVVLVAERFVELSAWQRSILLVVGAAGFGIALPQAMHRWVWGTRHVASIARLLTRRFPSLGDEIVGVLELGQQNQQGASDRLIAAAMEQTGKEAAQEDFTKATPSHRRTLWSLSTTVAIVAMLAAFVAAPAAAKNAWQRFLAPWTTVERFTFTQLEQLPERKIVPYGESFALSAKLKADSNQQPDFATASLGGAKITAQRDDFAYSFSIPGQSAESQLMISAGDCNRSIDIVPMTRPELVEVVAQVHLPEYLQTPEPLEIKSLSGRFSLLEGSNAQFLVSANRQLAYARLNKQPMDVTNATAMTPLMPIHTAETHWVQWQDEYGLASSKPVELEIRPIADRSPDCSLQRIEQRIVLHKKAIRLRYSAVDDFGIKHVGMEWRGVADPVDNPNPISGETILFAGGPTQDSIRSESVLSPERENIPPQILTLRLFTQDYRPDSERVYSLPQTVHVMSAAQHIAWVTEQMKRWKSKADAVYERELALNDENKSLQALSDLELATPENIRRLEQQSAGERENSQRLRQTVEDGRKLVEQALQNEDMNDVQIRRWAEALTRLQEIAGKRMPGISRKLSRLANEVKRRAEETQGTDGSASDDAGSDNTDSDDSNSASPNEDDPKGQQKKDPDSQKPNNQDPDSESSSTPNLTQREKSMLDKEEDSEDKNPEESAPPEGRLTIPEVALDSPKQEPTEEQEQQDQGGNEQQPPSIDEVVEDQDKLLEEFRKARGAMNEVMGELENSTFVKRLKAASLAQLAVAAKLNSAMSDLFGAETNADDSDIHADLVKQLSDSQTGMFEKLTAIEADLKAFQNREPNESRQEILEEMKSLNMRVKLEEMPLRLQRKRNGDSLHRTEFWADTFDRWAEELVPPEESNGDGGGGSGGSGDGSGAPSLPPAIVLEVLRLIDEEMQLRDETRSLDQAKAAMDQSEAEERMGGLTIYQMANQERTLDVIEDIGRLPNANQAYEDDLKKLNNAVTSMGEASSMLLDSMTGSPTIGAETAAIESLLEASRNNQPKSPPQDRANGEGDGSESLANVESPFDILKPSAGIESGVSPRDVGAALGHPADRVPEAYRNGLDLFRDRLRKLDQMQGRQ